MTFNTDGDHPTKGPKEAERVKEGQEAIKDAKGIQTMPSSPENHPVFVHLLAQAPLGMIDWILVYS